MWAPLFVGPLADWTQPRRAFSVEIWSLSRDKPVVDISGDKTIPENDISFIFLSSNPTARARKCPSVISIASGKPEVQSQPAIPSLGGSAAIDIIGS
jgi:hypothetical protein